MTKGLIRRVALLPNRPGAAVPCGTQLRRYVAAPADTPVISRSDPTALRFWRSYDTRRGPLRVIRLANCMQLGQLVACDLDSDVSQILGGNDGLPPISLVP